MQTCPTGPDFTDIDETLKEAIADSSEYADGARYDGGMLLE